MFSISGACIFPPLNSHFPKPFFIGSPLTKLLMDTACVPVKKRCRIAQLMDDEHLFSRLFVSYFRAEVFVSSYYFGKWL